MIIFITGLFRDVGKQCKEDIKTGTASFSLADSKFGDALPSRTRIWPSGLRSSVEVFLTKLIVYESMSLWVIDIWRFNYYIANKSGW